MIALRNRTIDSAPTMPSESTMLLVTARMIRVVTSVIASRLTAKLEE